MQKYGLECGVLTGALHDSLLIPFLPAHCNEMIAARKFKNYLRYTQLFPECKFIWFGDSGQGDIQTGLDMVKTLAPKLAAKGEPKIADESVTAAANAAVESTNVGRKMQPQMMGAFIQDVALKNGLKLKTAVGMRDTLAKQGVHVVNNYIEVALILARDLKVLTPQGLSVVCERAVQDLHVASAFFENPEVYAARRKEFNAALMHVNEFLTQNGLEGVKPRVHPS